MIIPDLALIWLAFVVANRFVIHHFSCYGPCAGCVKTIAQTGAIEKRIEMKKRSPLALSPTRRHFLAVAGGFFAGWLGGLSPAHAAETVRIRDLWAERGSFSPLAQKLAGAEVEMRGYMAPPLKPEIDFFVLTRIPMAVCPFCDSEASWPDDLVLVQSDRHLRAQNFNDLILVRGRLDLGTKTDAATGFVSRIRLTGANFQRV